MEDAREEGSLSMKIEASWDWINKLEGWYI